MHEVMKDVETRWALGGALGGACRFHVSLNEQRSGCVHKRNRGCLNVLIYHQARFTITVVNVRFAPSLVLLRHSCHCYIIKIYSEM